jgi:hypothetical protein
MTDPNAPETGMATGNDVGEPGVVGGPLDPEERAVLENLRDDTGADVVGTTAEERPGVDRAAQDDTPAPD